jgi:hypothetical protein
MREALPALPSPLGRLLPALPSPLGRLLPG